MEPTPAWRPAARGQQSGVPEQAPFRLVGVPEGASAETAALRCQLLLERVLIAQRSVALVHTPRPLDVGSTLERLLALLRLTALLCLRHRVLHVSTLLRPYVVAKFGLPVGGDLSAVPKFAERRQGTPGGDEKAHVRQKRGVLARVCGSCPQICQLEERVHKRFLGQLVCALAVALPILVHCAPCLFLVEGWRAERLIHTREHLR
eukprot:1900700-Prymnesium_polylepis.1